MFWAHSKNLNGEMEPLEKHLKKVSELAENFADAFGEGEAGKLIGWYHDIGKASDLFQGVLAHEEHNVNHAAAGAYILNNADTQLSRVIYAHHDGLVWNIKSDLDRSIKCAGSQDSQIGKRFSISGTEQYQKLAEYVRSHDEIPKNKPARIPEIESSYNHLSEMLHIRFLLSCLCDADYTATASHEDEKIFSTAKTENKADGRMILDKLSAFREKIRAKSNSDSELNYIRELVYKSCVDAGKKNTGMFTLTAPTGTGKTLALLAFAAEQVKNHNKSRIIIVLPFLSIISQNARIYREICGDVLESHSMSAYGNDDISRLISERWDSPVIVTTSVKFFEVLFKRKPTELRFLHNISNSVVVFDEAQSIPHELVGTTIESMRMLCEMYRCTVLLSTATQPAFDTRKGIEYHPTEIINDPNAIYKRTKRVKIDWQTKDKTSFEQIAHMMAESDSVCCVLNRKDHTRQLFSMLLERCSEDEIFHISTDMCKKHRDRVIEQVTFRLENDMPCRLVSTSCIEAGVDLDFSSMFRALAPLEAIVQCAGRCNRNGRKDGKMTVFIPDEEKLYPSKSYENSANKVLLLLSRHEIDICDPAHIREYYTELFSDSNYDHDKSSLVKAIEDHDFDKVEKEYKFIPQSGVNVLVPYSGEIELFEELVSEAHENGISSDWMRRAAGITVSSYREDKLRDLTEPCMMYYKGRQYNVSGWYMIYDRNFYDDDTGLYFTDESSLDYLI